MYLFISYKQALCYKAHAETEMKIESDMDEYEWKK